MVLPGSTDLSPLGYTEGGAKGRGLMGGRARATASFLEGPRAQLYKRPQLGVAEQVPMPVL